MITLLRSITASTLSPKSVAAKCARWAFAAAIGALALGSSDHASAQLSGAVIIDPAKQSDLSVAVSAPVLMQAYDIAALSMTATNAGPTGAVSYRAIQNNQVVMTMDLAGLEPLFVQAPPGFNCHFGARIWDQNFYYVSCTGNMAWGSSATMEVWAEGLVLCDTPAYTDAGAFYTGGQMERTSANNRAIARTDFNICIN
jgi:hypothetical protein